MKQADPMFQRIAAYEEFAANTWPALSVQCLGGWLLRSAGGYSKRANSVLPLYPSPLPVDEHIALCEEHYARLGACTVFKMTDASQPEGLDRELERRGYRKAEEVSVQTARLEAFGEEGAGGWDDGIERLEPEPWLEHYLALNPGLEPHRSTISRLFGLQPNPSVYVRVGENGTTAAVGLTAVAGRRAAVYDLMTAPGFRRRGYAGRALRALCAEARRLGAEEAFLQVLADNHAAIALYEKHGFREAYRQWYRIQPTR